MAGAGFRIEHRLGVPAPVHVVWQVLSDLESWADWNPFYVKAEGALRIGGQLRLTQAPPGQPQEVITPTILDWVPDAQILWRLSQSSGFVQRTRYLEIDKLSEEACIFSNGEDWAGFATRFVGKDLRRATRAGFEAMGEALRDRAVALWRSQGGAPTSAQT
jgi:hypothetical protein